MHGHTSTYQSSPSCHFFSQHHIKISPNVNPLPPCLEACPGMTHQPQTTLDATASLNDTLTKQLQILHQMLEITAKLHKLLDLTFDPLAAPDYGHPTP